ncbi:prepronociceptin b [Megalops cyprinoides]|uniref:prepronociceptin b n=1 Tax=Megalops cyprinoides TaxID=118141 RepID=UPI0018644F95|nr:prepronociceptin b [Megalops cyprinoides]
MKTPLWTLLLLCLCVPGRCDCQRDCLSCGLLLPQHHAFDTLVCLVECEGKISPGLTWELCRQAVDLPQLPSLPAGGDVLKRGEEEEVPALPSMDMEDRGLLYTEALQRFHHAARALGVDQPGDGEQQTDRFDSNYQEEETEQEGGEEEADSAAGPEGEGGVVDVSKRFGGFLKGKHAYRKLMDPGRHLQKRYGGFIGIRKSARKWNNQKRFSEFLKQYLGMTARSSHFNSLTADLTRQNEV